MARTIVDVFKKFLFLQFREITQVHASTVYAKIVKDWNQITITTRQNFIDKQVI